MYVYSQEIRNAAMNCIESSHELCSQLDFSGKKNGILLMHILIMVHLLLILVKLHSDSNVTFCNFRKHPLLE